MGDFDISASHTVIGSNIQLTLLDTSPNDTQIDFTLELFDDNILEDDEEFTVSIVDDPLFTTGTPSSVVFTIHDNDGEPLSTVIINAV